MSANPSLFPERTFNETAPSQHGLVSVRTVEAPSRARKVPDIRRQAAAIIEALLAISDSETAHEREQLMSFLEAHPGQPEVALAHHLLAVRPLLDKLSAGGEPDLVP